VAAALGRSVGVAGHQRMPGQEGLHDRALRADPPPVNEAHLAEAPGPGGFEILLDHRGDVARREGVQVE